MKRIPEKEAVIIEALAKKQLSIPVHYYSEVTSTMDAAKESLRSAPQAIAIYAADMQTAGRGRQSREWESLPGNLFVTIAFQVADVSKLTGFSLVAGLACASVLGSMGCRTRLKWPNDILAVSLKKLGGILIEVTHEGEHNYLLCGIGINLSSNPGVPNATSIKEIAGSSPTPTQVIVKLMPAMMTYFDKFMGSGFSVFRNEWNTIAAFIGRDISVHISKEKSVSGMFMGVSGNGSLQIERDGKIETLTAGDIKLLA